MPVQVFRVLVPSQISQHTARAMLGKDVLRHFTNHFQHFKQQWTIRFFERDQRRDVTLRNDDDVHGPERARVVIREHVIGFANDFYRRAARSIPRRSRSLQSLGRGFYGFYVIFGTPGGLVSDSEQ